MEKHNRKPHHRKAREVEPEQEQAPEHSEALAPEEQGTNVQPISIEKWNETQEELEKAHKTAEENLEGWRRERAEFINYRKRIERDQAQLAENITGEVVKKYLIILDDLERALKNRPSGEECSLWVQGVELIDRKLQNILESEGVTRIPAEGQEFNPEVHEAISHEESPDHQSSEIIEVVQQGYRIGDRVLRPALVRVAR